MHSYHYLFAGISITSRVDLPFLDETVCPSESSRHITVSEALSAIRLGALVKEELDEVEGRFSWRFYLSEDGIQLDVGDVGRFSISSDGSDVCCKPAAGASKDDFQNVVVGTVLNLALQSSGLPLLHAGAVIDAGRAVAISARSGFGKSTLIAHLARRGHPVLSDDTLPVLSFDQGVAEVTRHLPRMKLWDDSVSAVGFEPAKCESVFSWTTKRQIRTDGECVTQAAEGPHPLGALYLLAPTLERRDIDIRMLRGTSAALAVLGSMYMPSLLTGKRGASALDAAAEIAERTSVRVISYTRSFDALGELGDAILEDARGLTYG